MAITSNSRLKARSADIQVTANPFLTSLRNFWFSDSINIVSVFLVALLWFFPGFPLLFLTIWLPVLIINFKTDVRMPLKMPASSSQKIDHGSYVAGKENQASTPKGITCLGVDRETNRQVWEDADNDKRHHCMLATTGSGKTFSMKFNLIMALVQTTGVIAIDGKGDIELPLETVHLTRRFLREYDLRVLNFKQGAKNIYYESGEPRTNSFNPFASGSSTYIAEILKSLLSSDAEGSKGGDVFQKRAESMCSNVAKMATFMRDNGDFKIRPGTIANMLELRELCRIYENPEIPIDYKSSLMVYFKTLPDFEAEHIKAYAEGEEFKGKIMEQHSYVSMQLQPALQVLSDLYGFIFDTDSPEIDLKDVVINNRFLLVLLPAMEQSLGTLKDTGKILLAALKGMISGELGDKFQGNIESILNKRACSDPAPFKCFLDECGYYAAIPGIEILPGQGRGLGFSFHFVAQTYTDLEKGGKETADIIWANVNNKTIGKTETETAYNKIKDRLGEADVLVRDRVEIEHDGVLGSRRAGASSLSYQKKQVLEMKDLTVLREGETYHVTNDKLIKMRGGNPSIKSAVKESRYMQLIGLTPISNNYLKSLRMDTKTASDFFSSNLKSNGQKGINLKQLPRMERVLSTKTRLAASGIVAKHPSPKEWELIIYQVIKEDESEEEAKNTPQIDAIMKQANNTAAASSPKSKSPKKATNKKLPDVKKSDSIDDIPVNNSWPENDQDIKELPWTDAAFVAIERYELDPENFDDDNNQSYDDDDDGLEHVTSADSDKEFLIYQLNCGQITQEEFDEEMEQISLEEDLVNSEDVDDEYFKINSELDLVPFDLVDKTSSSNGATSPIDIDKLYPSEAARNLEKTTSKSASDLLNEIHSKFDMNI